MSGKVVPKLRIVKCPKCRQLLPEPRGCDVYKCGGCGTKLKAKKQSTSVNLESSIQEINAARRRALDLVSEGRQNSDRKHRVPLRKDSLKAKATISSRECYLDGNVENNGGQLVPFKFSDEEELDSELDIDKLSLRRNRKSNKGGSNKITRCEIEEISDNGDFSLERPKEELIGSSDEDGNDGKSALIEELNKGNFALEGANEELISGSDEDVHKAKSFTTGANPEVEIIGSDLEGVEDLNNENLPLEDLNSGIDGDVNTDKSALVGEILEGEIIANIIAGEKLNNGKWPLDGAEEDLSICAQDKEDHNNDQSAIEDAKSEVDTTEGITTKDPKTENVDTLDTTDLSICAPDKEDHSNNEKAIDDAKSEVDTTEGTPTKHQSTENVDTLDTTELRDHSSEHSDVLGKGKLSKSATTRSSYAYDDSLSSHDRMNERFPIQHLDYLKKVYAVAEGSTRKGKGLANSSLHGDLGTQHQSHIPHEKNHFMKESRRNQNKVLDNTRHGNSSWMKTKRDHEFPSRIPFHRSAYQSHYESGRPSNGMHDESTRFLSHDSRRDTDQEKMKLLRMIHKLQDQLDKTRYMSEETKENHSSAYHSHNLHDRRFSHALDHSRCNGRCNHGNDGIMLRQRHKYSRIPYSAEATSYAHHVDHSCFHCCSHVLENSSPRVRIQQKDLYRSCQGQDCCSSSPQCFTASKFPLYDSETHSDDQRHRATVVRKYLREKQTLSKRHHRPVAGGAPFVTCHKCLKLLQLPADFLLYKRVCHKLKCGDCSEVLKFSLKNGSHVVPFSSNTIGLPSSELHPRSEVISGSNLQSVSHVNYYHYSPAKPISYYDDYGMSVSQSYSSEVDPLFLTQLFHPLHAGEYVNPSVSPSSTFKENIASRYSGAIKVPMEAGESAEFSSNMSESRKLSAEKEGRPPQKSSLHKLMGSTSSQVIRGSS